MTPFRTRNQCSKEPAKIVPIMTEVKVADIPDNFPKTCEKMIGQTYSATVHVDRKGKTWYNILKELVLGEEQFNVQYAFQKQDSEKVSFQNRKYIKIPAKYCN